MGSGQSHRVIANRPGHDWAATLKLIAHARNAKTSSLKNIFFITGRLLTRTHTWIDPKDKPCCLGTPRREFLHQLTQRRGKPKAKTLRRICDSRQVSLRKLSCEVMTLRVVTWSCQ